MRTDLTNDLLEHQIVLGKLRGYGAYGEVYECEYDGYLRGAVKISNRPMDPAAKRGAEGELRKIKSLHGLVDCPNLIRLLRLLIVKDHLVTIWDLCDADLAQVLKTHQTSGKASGLPFEDLSRWFGQVASALEYVHEQGYLHRDIKPSNILVRNKNAFLGDLGSIVYIGLSDADLSYAGTVNYLAPEVSRADTAYSVASDVYSMALCYAELRTGTFPLGDDFRKYEKNKQDGRFHLEGLSTGERAQLERGLSPTPGDRPKEVGRWVRRLLQEARPRMQYLCRVASCESRFPDSAGLRSHVEDTHHWHLCSGCHYAFPSIHDLKHHQRTADKPACRGLARAIQ